MTISTIAGEDEADRLADAEELRDALGEVGPEVDLDAVDRLGLEVVDRRPASRLRAARGASR